MLYSNTKDLYSGETGLGLNESDYLDDVSDGNASGLFESLDVLSDARSTVGGMADSAPGGADSTVSGDDDTTDGALQRSGLGLVASAGTFLYTIPKKMIESVGNFLNIDPAFQLVASVVIILMVAIILVSSVLRNRI